MIETIVAVIGLLGAAVAVLFKLWRKAVGERNDLRRRANITTTMRELEREARSETDEDLAASISRPSDPDRHP